MMKAHAKRTVYYRYPAELVWKALGAGNNREVDPLSEEEFDNREPAPNMVFTKALDIRTNELFAIRMKAHGFISDLRIELKPVGPCETKVVFSEDVEYREFSTFFLSRFGLSVRQELRSFANEIHKRLGD